jgi:hypothetical protein
MHPFMLASPAQWLGRPLFELVAGPLETGEACFLPQTVLILNPDKTANPFYLQNHKRQIKKSVTICEF